MGLPDALDAPPSAGRTRRGSRIDNPLVRAVSRAPVTVRTKLVVVVAGIAVLLVAFAILGLRVLAQSNARVETLGTLQLRAAKYQNLQTQARQLRQLLALRGAQDPNLSVYIPGAASSSFTGRPWALVDEAIAAAVAQLGPASNESRFGFVPPPEDEALLVRIRSDFRLFTQTLDRIIAVDRAEASGKARPYLATVIGIDNDLSALTNTLAVRTSARTQALVSENRSAYVASQNLLIGVGAGSIVLAVLLGLVLSWSLVVPIQRTETRLAEIAAGDFSRHVEVANRDELGRLAANLNRMNDELRSVYTELETISRHKSEFVATMSHELRTPLNAIIGFSELLQQQPFGPLNERQLGYVEDVLGAGRHLLSVINDILDLSKVEAGKMELDLADISLRDTLESALSMQAERAAREGVALGLALDPPEITLGADERKLRQVVVNLLANAVRFTPAGGHVAVTARLGGDLVEIAVTDTGPGIAPEDQELIFEEFRQLRDSAGQQGEGSGLGLPLARRLVELHGGRLWVESTRGQGSTFRFTLPVAPRP